MMAMNAVFGLDKVDLKPKKSCAPCIEETMPSTAMKSRTTLETRPSAVLHTDVAEISLISVGGSRYFVTLIDEASRHVSAFHKEIKAEAAEVLKRQVKWVERRTKSKLKKTVLDSAREYLKGCTELGADGIDIGTTAYYRPEEDGHAERMNRTVKNAVRTIRIHSGAPANLCAECLYAVCKANNHVVRAEHSTTPQELFTEVKPTFAHLWTFGCQVWVRVPDKKRKALEAKARPGILHRSISYGMYPVIM